MAGEYRHKDIGTELTKTEWEAVDAHEASGETTNDMLYYNGTNWIRATQATIAGLIDSEIQLDNLAATDDNTDLDSSTTKHGLLPKLGGGSTNYLRADGTWAAPVGAGAATTELDNLGTVAINTSLISDTDNTDDLGSATKEWKDLYVDGTGYIDTINTDKIALANTSEPALSISMTSITGTDNQAIDITGGEALDAEEHWTGIRVKPDDLDPGGADTRIRGMAINMSGVATTNSFESLDGLRIKMPEYWTNTNALDIAEGKIRQTYTVGSSAGALYTAYEAIIDTGSLHANSDVHIIDASTSDGAPSGTLSAIGTHTYVAPVHQHIGAYSTPSQTEYAGRKTGGGASWADGVDGNEIFIANSDEVYLGSTAQFDEIEVIMTTPGTKTVSPTFWYNTAADTWTQFYPSDLTDGCQQSGLITWELSDITALWTNDGDPGGANASTGYWIKVIRTGAPDPGTPTPTTIKTGVVTLYTWTKDGDIYLRNIGRDADNLLDFATDNEITFRTSATDQISLDSSGVLNTNAIHPSADNTDDLGSAAKEWKDAYIDGTAYIDNIEIASGETITGDGTDMTIASGAKIELTATSDVVLPVNVGVVLGDGAEKIESNNTDLTIESGVDINLTATTDINVPTNVGMTFGDDGEKIEGDGTDFVIASSGILTLQSGAATAASFSAIGVATYAKQAMAGAYQDAAIDQVIETTKVIRVLHDTEFYDVQNEFDSTVKTGAADATEAFELHDADGGFASGDIGAWVWNTTDNTYAIVTAFTDSGQITLDTDIMVDTEGYKLYKSEYTATEAGKYLCVAGVQYLSNIADAGSVATHIFKNSTAIGEMTAISAKANASVQASTLIVAGLAANDIITHTTKHWEGSAKAMAAGASKVFLYVIKIA